MDDSRRLLKALQASECSELLDRTTANCWISAQHQPGKFASAAVGGNKTKFRRGGGGALIGCSSAQLARALQALVLGSQQPREISEDLLAPAGCPQNKYLAAWFFWLTKIYASQL
jgi:hypothetical protein